MQSKLFVKKVLISLHKFVDSILQWFCFSGSLGLFAVLHNDWYFYNIIQQKIVRMRTK